MAAFLVLGGFWTVSAQEQARSGRYALVIGNSHYTELTSLKNPGNDAADMAVALKGLGFDVTLRLDELVRHVIYQLGFMAAEEKAGVGDFFRLAVEGYGHALDDLR
jgi:hypothetical protein